MKQFWMIIRSGGPGSESAKFRHITLGSARLEAERLCRKTGAAFVVLAAIEHCKPAEYPIEWETIKEEEL